MFYAEFGEKLLVDYFVEFESVDFDGESDQFVVVPPQAEVVVGVGQSAEGGDEGPCFEPGEQGLDGVVGSFVQVVAYGLSAYKGLDFVPQLTGPRHY